MEKIKLNPEEIIVELLNEDNQHHIGSFCSAACQELEKFLKENAWKEQSLGFSKTYLFFHNNILAGYVTLLTDKQPLKHDYAHPSLAIFEKKLGGAYSSVPALKIGRICVADKYNSQLEIAPYAGLGTIIFMVVLNHTKELASKVGCRVVTTNAKKITGAYLWYQKLGFQFSNKEERVRELLAKDNCESIPMFFDTKRVI